MRFEPLSPAQRFEAVEMLEPDEHTPGRLCGHVFLLHCSLPGLAADAKLLEVSQGHSVPLHTVRRQQNPDDPRSLIFEGNIMTHEHVKPGWTRQLHETVQAYLEMAGVALRGTKSEFHRARPLMGLVMPGTGELDKFDLISDDTFVQLLLPKVYYAAQKYEVDVAICTTDFSAFNVMQALRGKCCPWTRGPFWMLSLEQKKQCVRLQKVARSGRLSLLFGAGISVPSDLPSWGELLKTLARKVGMGETEMKQLDEIALLDQAPL